MRGSPGGGGIRNIFHSRLPERLAGRIPAPLVELAIGLIVPLVLVLARMPFASLAADRAPFAFNFFALVVAAVLAGWRSGLVALVTGQLLTWYFIVEPRWSFAIPDGERLAGLFLATAAQLLVLAVIALYQREVSRALASQERQMGMLSEALREIDHRTKNNYQTVVALITLQAKQATDPAVKQALREAADRVNAVSLASDKLALRSENLGTVRLGDHLCELCEQIRRGLTRDGVKVHCDVANLSASTEKAIYLSIIVNELVTNALKHAFLAAGDGEIRVSSSDRPEGIAIVVQDSGSGISATKARGGGGLGTRLVERFVKQIGAAHKVESSSSGTTHTILLPNLD